MGPYMIALANVTGNLIGPSFQACLSIRSQIIIGQFGIFTCLCCVSLFAYMEMTYWILGGMVATIMAYQMSMGPYFWVYVSQVSNESQNSLAVASLWLTALTLSMTTADLIESLGIIGTFLIFAGITLIGAFYFIGSLLSTQGLSQAQCKQIFWPVEFKKGTESLL